MIELFEILRWFPASLGSVLELPMHAALGLPDSAGQYTGAVSHYISAVLQTAGLLAQSDILKSYREMLTSIGQLLYLIAIIAALSSLALFGDYKKAIFLVFGPLIFFAMVYGTIKGKETVVRNGERLLKENSKLTQVDLLNLYEDNEYDEQIELSWFFVTFDNLVTEIVQSMVALLVDTKNKEDVRNEARERVYALVFRPSGYDPGFIELVSDGIPGRCASVTNLQMDLAQLRRGGAASTDSARLTEDEQRRAQELEDEIARQESLSQFNLSDTERDYINHLNISAANERGAGVSVADFEALKAQTTYSCRDLWKFVRVGAMLEAGKSVDTNTNNCTPRSDDNGNSVPWDEVCNDLFSTIGGKDLPVDEQNRRAHQIIAAFIIKNTLSRTTHSMMVSQFNAHSPVNGETDMYNELYTSVLTAEGQGALMGLTYFRATIPYVQGVLLFLLAAGFPFFCVFLVIPSKYESFIIWMGLWVWVKSWDAGFGMVQVVGEILWEYIGTGVKGPDGSLPDFDWNSPTSIIQLITRGDPLANVNTYYWIMSLVTISIPFLSAHLCLGATNVFSAFKASINGAADNLSRSRAAQIRQDNANQYDIMIEAEQQAFANARAGSQMGNNIRGDGLPSVRAKVAYQKALADWHFGQRSRTLQGLRSMHTTRKDIWASNVHNRMTQQGILDAEDKYLMGTGDTFGSAALARSDIPGVGQAQTGFKSGDAPNPFGGTSRLGGGGAEQSVRTAEQAQKDVIERDGG